MVLATGGDVDGAASFAYSLSSSANSACPDKGSDQGRAEGSEHSRTSASSRFPNPTPVSNRELSLLERALSCCKQRKATLSNRELSTNQCCCNFCVPVSLHKSLNRLPIRTSVLTKEGSLATGHCSTLTGNRGTAPKCASPEKLSALPNLNRQIHEFRNAVTCRKQTMAHCSNSQKTQKWMYAFSPFFPPTRTSLRTNAPTENEL